MKTAIIDYGSGNLHSALKAIEKARHDRGLDGKIIITDKAETVAISDRIVLPGVGAFADCRAGLDKLDGMVEALQEVVIDRGRPFLGICVGTQLMASTGFEKTITPGLNWISGEVKPIVPDDETLKIPQIGWNTIEVINDHELLAGIKTGNNGQHAYFVHSYHIVVNHRSELIAQCDYGTKVTAIVGRDNMIGTQFHPEKSQKFGLTFLANFLQWSP